MGCVLIPFVPPAASQPLTHRFALFIEALRHAVARRGGRGGLPGPLLVLIWSRLRRMAARFTQLAERGPARSGPAGSGPAGIGTTLSAVKAPGASAAPQPRTRASLQPSRSFASLLRLVPETAQLTGQLRHLLADPEMAPLLAATPELGRILRPLCHMLGIRPVHTASLYPPPRSIVTPKAERKVPPAKPVEYAEVPPPLPPPAPPPTTPPTALPLGLSLSLA